MSFSSDRQFKIWAYSVSHSFLLLRSNNPDEDNLDSYKKGYNIDIELIGVAYLDLPVFLNGISIEELKDNIPDKFRRYPESLGYKVFKITSDKTYYVVAANYLVGRHHWEAEDRINNPYLEYEEILSTS